MYGLLECYESYLLEWLHEDVLECHEVIPEEGGLRLEEVPDRLSPLHLQALHHLHLAGSILAGMNGLVKGRMED